jgi:hypothetical protein
MCLSNKVLSTNLTVGIELLGVLPGVMSMFSIILMTLQFTVHCAVRLRRSFNVQLSVMIFGL